MSIKAENAAIARDCDKENSSTVRTKLYQMDSGKESSFPMKIEQNPSCSEVLGSGECGLEGFHLDLDLEPTSSSNSCCSGDEDSMEGNTAVLTDDEKMDDSFSENSVAPSPQSIELDDNNDPEDSPKKEQWSVTSPEPGKMLFSRLDNMGDGTETERISVKQISSNRIQLRNGRVLPPQPLTFLTSQQKSSVPLKSPKMSQSKSPPTPPRNGSSKPVSLRRSKRLAGSYYESKHTDYTEEDEPEMVNGGKGYSNSPSVCSPTSFSGESEFDMLEFSPTFQLESPKVQEPTQTKRATEVQKMTTRKRSGVGCRTRGRCRKYKRAVHPSTKVDGQ